jgi:hypothetical protein
MGGGDLPDGEHVVEYTPADGPRRRIRYEPRADGDGYLRVVDEWTGCNWRQVGAEPVADLVVERAPRS